MKLYSILSLSTKVYKWVPVRKCWGYPVVDWHPIQGGKVIFLVASCYTSRLKLGPCGLPVARRLPVARGLPVADGIPVTRVPLNHYLLLWYK